MKKHILKEMRLGHVKNIYQKGLGSYQIYYLYYTFSAQWNDSLCSTNVLTFFPWLGIESMSQQLFHCIY